MKVLNNYGYVICKEEKGMSYLWNLVNKLFDEEYRIGVFLAANIVCWTAGTFLTGMFFCMVAGHSSVAGCIANVMCMAVYAGVIMGLFGGILYLMRRTDGRQGN